MKEYEEIIWGVDRLLIKSFDKATTTSQLSKRMQPILSINAINAKGMLTFTINPLLSSFLLPPCGPLQFGK